MAGITTGTFIAAAVLAVLFRFCRSDVILSLAVTAGTTCYHFAMRLLTGLAYDVFMKNRADYRKARYSLKPWEPALYRKLRVRYWKGKLPTYDPELFDTEKRTLDEIAQATCQAELVHETIAVLSFLPIAAGIWLGNTGVFVITSVLAAGIDLLFVIVQRYNRPRIIQLIERKARNRKESSRTANGN